MTTPPKQFTESTPLKIEMIPSDSYPLGIVKGNGYLVSLKYEYMQVSPYIWTSSLRNSELRNVVFVNPGEDGIYYDSARRFINRDVTSQDEWYLMERREKDVTRYEIYNATQKRMESYFDGRIFEKGSIRAFGSIGNGVKHGYCFFKDKDGIPHIVRNISTHNITEIGRRGENIIVYVIYSISPISKDISELTHDNDYELIYYPYDGKYALVPYGDMNLRDKDGYYVKGLVEKAYKRYV